MVEALQGGAAARPGQQGADAAAARRASAAEAANTPSGLWGKMASALRVRPAALWAGMILAAVVGAGPAQGQTVLIDTINDDPHNQGVDFGDALAQAFTTGNQSGGYALGSIEFEVWFAAPDTTVNVTLRADSSGSPGDVLHTLSGTLPTIAGGANQIVAFSAGTGGYTLDAGTTYFVVYEHHNVRSTLEIAGGNSNTAAIVARADTDWVLRGVMQRRTERMGSFSNFSGRYLKFRLNEAFNPGKPEITGTATNGQVLMAAPGNIDDEDGLTSPTYTYQWLRANGDESDEAEIDGATSSTYTLTEFDVNKKVRVRASFTDDGSNSETRTSDFYPSTGTVAPQSGVTSGPNTARCTIGFTSTPNPPTRNTIITASVSDCADPADGLPQILTLSYQWQRIVPGSTPVDVGSAVSEYRPEVIDVGNAVQVVVSFMDSNGNSESVTSSRYPATGTIVSDNSLATGKPLIQGTARVGETLTATTGDVADASTVVWTSFVFQWQRENAAGDSWEDIAGASVTATSQSSTSTYTLDSADEGRRIRVRGRFFDSIEYPEEVFSDPTAAVTAASNNVPAGMLAVTGTAQVGQTLTAAAGTVSDGDNIQWNIFVYQWQRENAAGDDWEDIAGASTTATSQSSTSMYTLVAGDLDRRIRVRGNYTDGSSTMEEVYSNPTAAVVTDNNPPVGLSAIVGTASVGQDLRADTKGIRDPDGPASLAFNYQWLRADGTGQSQIDAAVSISGAMVATYTLVDADQGKHILVRVTFTDGESNRETLTSAPTVAVAQRGNSPATGLAISGTAQVGQALSAVTTGITDTDGTTMATYVYQWQRETSASTWVDIATATSSAYTLLAADLNLRIRVRVSFTDDNGNSEVLFSDPSARITAASTPVPVVPAPSGPSELSIVAQSDPAEEGGPGETSNLVFTVSLDPPSSQTVTVDFSHTGGTAAPGVDFSLPANRTLTFLPGGSPQTVTAVVRGDFIREPTETVVLSLSNPTGSAELGTASATGEIANRTAPAVLNIAEASAEEGGAEQQTVVRCTVAISAPLGYDVTVQYQLALVEASGSGASARSVSGRACNAFPISGTTSISARQTLREVVEEIGTDCQLSGDLAVLVTNIRAAGQEAVPDVVAQQSDTGAAIAATVVSRVPTGDWAAANAISGIGRSVAIGMVDTVWSRAAAHRHGSVESYARLGNRSVAVSAFTSEGSAQQAAQEIARLFGVEAVNPALATDTAAYSDPLAGGDFDEFRGWAGVPDSDGIAKESSFSLSLGGRPDGIGSFVFWGGGGIGSFKNELEDDEYHDLTIDGATATGNVGVDYQMNESVVLGLVVSHSTGDVDYSLADGGQGTGEVTSSLSSLSHWLRWQFQSGMEIWGAVGFGTGAAEVGHGDGNGDINIEMQMASAGAWRKVVATGGADIAAKMDILYAAVSPRGMNSRVKEVDSDSKRLRLALEFGSRHDFEDSGWLNSRTELGARLDGSAADSGAGVDLMTELSYAGLGRAIQMKGRGSLLLLHQQEGFGEWGFGLEFAYDPGADRRGFQVSLEPTWNASRSNVADSMWNVDSSDDLSLPANSGAALRARLGYGVDAMWDRAAATVYGDVKGEEKESRFRLGSELRKLGDLRMDIYGEMREHQEGVERSVMLEGRLGF